MLDLQLSVHIDDAFAGVVSGDWLRRAAELTLGAASISSPVELGIVVAGDDAVRELNRTYRGVDAATDVLAFALCETGGDGEHFVLPPDGTLHLGDIVISYPRAEEQAKEHREPVERELALLVAHGVLHLLGYDHQDPAAEQTMRAMEAEVLRAIVGNG